MPSTATHAFFAKDVYDILPEKLCEKLDVEKSKMYGQSVDSLKFYNLFSLAPGKKIRDFQSTFHDNQTQEFFLNLLKYMKDKDTKDKDTYSYLFGMICHYALDSTLHPYIVYRTGIFDKNRPSTYKYNNVHTFMENFIDNDMIRRRTNTNPYFFDFSEFCFDISPFSEDLAETIDYAFYNTFQISEMSKIYYKSLKQMDFAIKVFRRDPYGIKKFFYKLVDSFTSRRCFRFEAISYHYPLEDRHNFLNSNHSTWRNPCIYDATSKESFVDLYLKAIKFAKVLMCASCDYLEGKNIDLEKVFDNKSYVTGIDCIDKKELKYFDF